MERIVSPPETLEEQRTIFLLHKNIFKVQTHPNKIATLLHTWVKKLCFFEHWITSWSYIPISTSVFKSRGAYCVWRSQWRSNLWQKLNLNLSDPRVKNTILKGEFFFSISMSWIRRRTLTRDLFHVRDFSSWVKKSNLRNSDKVLFFWLPQLFWTIETFQLNLGSFRNNFKKYETIYRAALQHCSTEALKHCSTAVLFYWKDRLNLIKSISQ